MLEKTNTIEKDSGMLVGESQEIKRWGRLLSRRKWACCDTEESTQKSPPDVVAQVRQAFIDEARQCDLTILCRRPDLISVTVYRATKEEKFGLLLGQEADYVQVENLLSSGLLVIEKKLVRNSSLAEGKSTTYIQPGDVLESINQFSCRKRLLADVKAHLAEVVGMLTFVFSTTTNNQGLLCQAIAVKPRYDPDSQETSISHGVKLGRQQNDLQIDRLTPKSWLSQSTIFADGDLVVGICDNPSLTLAPEDAQLLLDSKAQSSEYISIMVISKTPAQRRWKQVRKATVAVGGSTLLGVGAVLMVTPLHPVGHAMAIGGISVLGTEFDAPKRCLHSVKTSVTSMFQRNGNRTVEQAERSNVDTCPAQTPRDA
jgi:hypothetical protein